LALSSFSFFYSATKRSDNDKEVLDQYIAVASREAVQQFVQQRPDLAPELIACCVVGLLLITNHDEVSFTISVLPQCAQRFQSRSPMQPCPNRLLMAQRSCFARQGYENVLRNLFRELLLPRSTKRHAKHQWRVVFHQSAKRLIIFIPSVSGNQRLIIW
jgi:alpha/beta superfamily hydrolase